MEMRVGSMPVRMAHLEVAVTTAANDTTAAVIDFCEAGTYLVVAIAADVTWAVAVTDLRPMSLQADLT